MGGGRQVGVGASGPEGVKREPRLQGSFLAPVQFTPFMPALGAVRGLAHREPLFMQAGAPGLVPCSTRHEALWSRGFTGRPLPCLCVTGSHREGHGHHYVQVCMSFYALFLIQHPDNAQPFLPKAWAPAARMAAAGRQTLMVLRHLSLGVCDFSADLGQCFTRLQLGRDRGALCGGSSVMRWT